MQRTSVHGIRYQFHPSANLQTSHLIEMAISPTILTIVLSVPIILKFTEASLLIGYTFPQEIHVLNVDVHKLFKLMSACLSFMYTFICNCL